MNLTHIARYGKVACFSCQKQFDRVPDAAPIVTAAVAPPPVSKSAPPAPPTARPAKNAAMSMVTPRAPKNPVMPSAEESRAVMEQCLVGLERAAQDREMLCALDLRTIVARFVETVQAAVDLDTIMANGEITEGWLCDAEHLDAIARLCFARLWPAEGPLLPPSVQVWVLAVDEAARRWQYARRRWLAETFGLTMMPTVTGITTTNPAWHDITGAGQVITRIFAIGFLLNGEVLRKALVRA